MNLYHDRPFTNETYTRDAFILLTPIALTCVAVLWFFTDPLAQLEYWVMPP